AEAALLAPAADEGAVVNLEAEAEALFHLALPLEADGGGADDEDLIDPLPEEELLHDEACLDGLAQADVVGDEEVDPRQLERLHERHELVAHQLDAGAEGRLEEPAVGRCDRAPLEGMEVRGEASRLVETVDRTEALGLRVDDAGAELALPQDLEL